MSTFENELLYCWHCEKDTLHSGRYSDHERDASADCYMCHECKWEYNGYSGKYHDPDNYSNSA